MKKVLIIMGLCLFQTACSTQDPQPARNSVLLEFVDLASEMTIRHEPETAVAAPSRLRNESPVDSS